MTKYLLHLVGLTLIALAIAGVGWYGVITYEYYKKMEMQNQARFYCAQSSRYETKDAGGATVSYPVEELYLKCLGEMGVK